MRSIRLLAVVLAAVLLVPWPDCSRTHLQDNTCSASRIASAQTTAGLDNASTEVVPWRLTDDFGSAAAVAAAEAATAGIVASDGSVTVTAADQDRRASRDSSSSSRSRDSRSRGQSSNSSGRSSNSRRPDAADILRFWNSKKEEQQEASSQNSNPTASTTAEHSSNQRDAVRTVFDSSSSNSNSRPGRAARAKAAPTRTNRPILSSRSAITPSRPVPPGRNTSGPRFEPRRQRIVSAGVFGADPAREVSETGSILSGQGDSRVVSIRAVNGEYDPNDTGSSGNPVVRPPGFFTDRQGIIEADRGSSRGGSGNGGSSHSGSGGAGSSSSSSGGSGGSSGGSGGSSGGSGGSSRNRPAADSNRSSRSNRSSNAGNFQEPRSVWDKPARGNNSNNSSRDNEQAANGQEPRNERQQQNSDGGNRDDHRTDGQQRRQQNLDSKTPETGNRDSNSGRSTESRPARDEKQNHNLDETSAGDSNRTSPARHQSGEPGPNRDSSEGGSSAQQQPRGSHGVNNDAKNKMANSGQPGGVRNRPGAPAGSRGGSGGSSSSSRGGGGSSSIRGGGGNRGGGSSVRRNRRPISGTTPPESSGAGGTLPTLPPLADFGSSSSSGDVEQQQLLALQQLLPKLLVVGTQTWPLVDGLFKDAPARLSEWLVPNLNTGVRDYTEFIDTRGYGFLSITMIRDAGRVYVTELYAYDAGMDLSILPQLVSQLPRLQSFTCSNCMHNERGPDSAMQLPRELGDAAPASLAMLSLGGCKIRGSLPEAWSRWNTLEQLWVWDNALTGTIPASWKSMSKLRVFYAEQNQFTGELPASWGTGALPADLAVYLHKNLKLSGGIPESWGRFSGVIDVSATNVTGCVPDLLVDNVITDGTPEPCSPNDPNSELTALLGIRNGVRAMMGEKALASWTDPSVGAKAAPTLDHCRWQGIACNSDGRVTTLDMSFLKPDPEEHETPLPKVMQYVKRLKHLQVLNLANMALVGALEEDKPLSDDMSALAADLTQLAVLNISSNPGVTGSFPRLWAGLTSLQVLDVSSTGVISKLPDVWGSLQQLQLFRAAKTKIYGNLPGAWGMMKSITEIDLTGCNITGPLPAQWADAAAMQAVAAAAVQSAQQIAIAAHQDAQQAKAVLMESKDQLKQPPSPLSGVSSASAQSSSYPVNGANPTPIIAAAQDSIAVAMDQYHQVQLEATQSQLIADTMQFALTKAAQDMQLNGYGLGMMNLQVLKLSNNEITGGLPVSYASFQKLRVLNLSGNGLSGPLPMEWAALDNLQELSLANNPKLSGVLPDYWARLTNLNRLDLSNCGLSGKLPATWVSLQNAVSLNLSNNMFSGDVPEAWSFMTVSKYKLRCLNLSGNSGLTNLPKVQEAWQENSPVKVVVKAGRTC